MDQVKRGFMVRYLPYARQIKRLGERLNELEKRMEGVHSPQLNGMPRGTRRYSLDDDMARYDELMMRVQSLRAEAQPIKSEILNCIDNLLEPQASAVLELRFIDDASLKDIGAELYMSPRTVSRWYDKGMDLITLPADYKPARN
ncbi:sigma factor-like helix-turn-helix DNA-binding protein [Lactiplantibacillus plantarum]|uniref:sigma factor-like helix-turn-helix DNA-binding protein n=1 Tax=Lactiplantibacillus plantarum TaxID=1590 RepID=UPI000717743D|nr:sigma factor-like helix-turn-helix DNA-binding protein [Lactiplantibacillus plantarum]KRU19860.1 hypothetical protein ASU25_03810 [Lactiplantibacillus plantarum]MCG0593395.1 Prophage protein [Lactiplantibacillus plantarum]MCG0665175.1 Prophage protein [Lactiplantibacillus plantarum]MCG0671948.1 Prophage protein [Lactiplantibacillus plantarum]MCG0739934.1 Prophage protein [Lactiplantibacillus plantarum]